MITISTFALTIYLFGFLGSPNEPLIVAAAKTMCRKLTSNCTSEGRVNNPSVPRASLASPVATLSTKKT